jgi:hypothetical protein
MCGQKAAHWAWHEHLKKVLPVCEHCYSTNQWLKEAFPAGSATPQPNLP